MERNFNEFRGGGWPQNPSDPVYQRLPSSTYESFLGNTCDKYGPEDSWRSSHSSDSWRDEHISRISGMAVQSEDSQGWKRNLSPECSRIFPKNQFNYVRHMEFHKTTHRPKPRGHGRHRHSSERPSSGKGALKLKSYANAFEEKKSCDNGDEIDATASVSTNSQETSMNGKDNCVKSEETKCENREGTEDSHAKQETSYGVKEEPSEVKSSESNSKEQNEKKETCKLHEEEDVSKKLIIRKDFTHDDIHHFKPIAIRDPGDKPKIMRHREPGWVAQWEMNTAALKEGASKSGVGSKPSSLSGELDGQRTRSASSKETEGKQMPISIASVVTPILDPEQYIEELSNPDLTDPSQTDDLGSQLMPKRKKTLSSTEEDWRSGAKTTLLGPPPTEEKREISELRRSHRPGLLGGPPAKMFCEEVVSRRTLKPGLLDGPRRDLYGSRPYSAEEDSGPCPAGLRNGPLLMTDSFEGLSEGLLVKAANSLAEPELVSNMAKKGIAELLLSNETLKAKITELYSEELKKLLLKEAKGDNESSSAPQTPEKVIRETRRTYGPRAGKALLGAPPSRRPDSIPSGPSGRFEDINRNKYYNDSFDGQWREDYRIVPSTFDESSDYYREGPSQSRRDNLYRRNPHDYRQQSLLDKERFEMCNTWDELPIDNAHVREWMPRDFRGSDNYPEHFGRFPRSIHRGTQEIRRLYGSSYRCENRSRDYDEYTHSRNANEGFERRETHVERRHKL